MFKRIKERRAVRGASYSKEGLEDRYLLLFLEGRLDGALGGDFVLCGKLFYIHNR